MKRSGNSATPRSAPRPRFYGVRGYVRYVDDFVPLDGDRKRLELCETRIREFLRDRLKPDVRARPIAPASEGVYFVGYIVRPHYLLPRRRVVKALCEKLALAQYRLGPVTVAPGALVRLPGIGPVRGPVRAWRLDAATIEDLRATWASTDGHLTHASSFRLRGRLWRHIR